MNGPLATYESLLRIFVDAEENDCAEVLCKLLGAGMDVLCVCVCVCVCVHAVCVHAPCWRLSIIFILLMG